MFFKKKIEKSELDEELNNADEELKFVRDILKGLVKDCEPLCQAWLPNTPYGKARKYLENKRVGRPYHYEMD